MKSGYEPGQRADVNTFSMWGELITGYEGEWNESVR